MTVSMLKHKILTCRVTDTQKNLHGYLKNISCGMPKDCFSNNLFDQLSSRKKKNIEVTSPKTIGIGKDERIGEG